MNILNITIKQLTLIICASGSIPLLAFVLGFVLSKSHFSQMPPPVSSDIVETTYMNNNDEHESKPTEVDTLIEVTGQQVASELPELVLSTSKTSVDSASVDVAHAPTLELQEAEIPAPGLKDSVELATSQLANLEYMHVLQLGIFSEKRRAIELARKSLPKSSNIRVFVKDKSDGKPMYSVIAGMFSDRAMAKAYGEQLKKDHNLDYYVTKSESLGREVHIATYTNVVASSF